MFRPRIARLILASNLAGMLVIIIGASALNEIRAELVRARAESLRSQGQLVASVIADRAATGSAQPAIIKEIARYVLGSLSLPQHTRSLLFDVDGALIGDSLVLSGKVDADEVFEPPSSSVPPGKWERVWQKMSLMPWRLPTIRQVTGLEEEIAFAQQGIVAGGQRRIRPGRYVISVTVPVRRVSVIVGAVTMESSDVDTIIAAQRAALLPIILVAILVALAMTVLLTLVIARPLRRLAAAADNVRSGDARKLDLPALTARRDEIGDLATSLTGMTHSLADRAEANARFAADVAHELKNPLTSIRSAAETGQAIEDPAIRARMLEIIEKDVSRMNRLITDISAAGQMEATSARHPRMRIDLLLLLTDLVDAMEQTRPLDSAPVVFIPPSVPACFIDGHEDLLVQLIRNLVGNARSFLSRSGQVTIRLIASVPPHSSRVAILVEDDGPGIPTSQLEKIFERFYSDRNTSVHDHSGLGLSIAKEIVRTHGGTIRALNRLDGERVIGARFIIELPKPQEK